MGHRIIFATPAWHLSGVNTMTAKLAHALQQQGHEVKILLTRPDASEHHQYSVDGDLVFEHLSLPANATFPVIWKSLHEHLRDRAPCVFFPGYDFENSTVCPALPPGVATIGVLHSDEGYYFEMTQRVGASWNRIVGVSSFLSEFVRQKHPQWADKTVYIPYGVDLPTHPPPDRPSSGPLHVIIAGRVSRYQKRIDDLPAVLDHLAALETPIHMAVVGSGPDLDETIAACRRHIEERRISFTGALSNSETVALFERQHAILMLSEFEGLPLVLLEAMARGCVPVTSAIRSGIPELVHDGKTGYQFPIGDTRACAERLHRLATDDRASVSAMSRSAAAHIAQGPYSTQTMVGSYLQIINETIEEASRNQSPGRTGRMMPPPQLHPIRRWRVAASRFVRRFLKKRKP
ncbi:MAG: glycosyltransferase [Verrucomicrobia bacterium]|nr:MAG: glycosyltransferase [Verrucomicrobiota bacterium]